MINPIIKWSGSKRSQVDEIIRYFPRIIDTYYEPFVGGGSVLYQLLSKRHVNHVVCSDINPDLISLWNLIKTSPEALMKHYEELWNKLYYIEDIEIKKLLRSTDANLWQEILEEMKVKYIFVNKVPLEKDQEFQDWFLKESDLFELVIEDDSAKIFILK